MKSFDKVVEVEGRVDVFGHPGQALVSASHLGCLDGHDVRALDQRLGHHSRNVVVDVVQLLQQQRQSLRVILKQGSHFRLHGIPFSAL